ncbi:MAG: hypothetical protein ACRD0K_03850 [Egibacteraceae bacterium]
MITAGGVVRLLRDVAVAGTAMVVVSHDERLLAVRVLRLADGRLTSGQTPSW